MTDIHEMRRGVKNLYPRSKAWGHKVDRMLDAQVIAIYMENVDKINSAEKPTVQAVSPDQGRLF